MEIPEESKILELAEKVFETEIQALEKVKKNLGPSFKDALELILNCKGKVVLTGMGKSGLIARKIAATLSSTGTLSIYMHPAEGLHGDLGVVDDKDLMIMLGKSGEVDEILSLLPVLKKIGCKIIAITGNVNSTLARNSHVVLNTEVDREACSLNLAPTSSTTAALVMGDALATLLSQIRDFKEEDFALYHPGGTLGKRLLLKVSDFIHPLNEIAVCSLDTKFRNILIEMSDKNLGASLIVDNGVLKGIISDGDIKRILTKYNNVDELTAQDIMTPDPKFIEEDMLAYDALKIMKKSGSFGVMPVLNKSKLKGLIKLHDLLKTGL